MRTRIIHALKTLIPLFAEKPCSRFKMLHRSILSAALPPSPLTPFVPLDRSTAGARSEGQGRPLAGAPHAPLTAASTLAGWRHSGDRARSRYIVFLFAAVLPLGCGSAFAVAQSVPTVRPAAVGPYAAHIADASQRFGIPEHWILAVLRAESAGEIRAISLAGAMGLMQIMPDTWAELRARYGLGDDPFDTRDNILAGTAYLREMWDRYGNVAAMLAAYNAGPARYDEYLATGRTLPAETRAYIAALAPVLGGATAPNVVISPPPPDWREAPLFVARSADAPTAAAPQSGDARAAVPVRNSTDTEQQDGSIFVDRASDAGTP